MARHYEPFAALLPSHASRHYDTMTTRSTASFPVLEIRITLRRALLQMFELAAALERMSQMHRTGDMHDANY
jgi:hypothetical protein